MPTLGAPLDFAKLEGRNFQAHQLGTAPSSPVKGQLYFNTGDNTLYWFDGTAWQSAKGGVSSIPDATPSVKGILQLAGDLAGTATSPQIAAGVITDAEVNSSNKDGVAGVASMRTIGPGALQAMAGSTRLDQVPAPTASVSLNGQRITTLMDPVSPADAATKLYVDGVAQGLAPKDSVRCATTGNIAIATALNPGDTIDGITLVDGDRVLVKDQSAPAENGIYIVGASPARAADTNAWVELPGAFTFVEQGTANADSGWVCTSDQGGTLGTTAVTWVQFSGAGQITAGAGMTKSGNTLDVGQGSGILVASDSISVDSAVIPKYYSSATHSAGTTITITQSTHGCRASRGLIVQCQIEATGAVVLPDISVAANGDITITFAVSQSANTIRTTVIG